MIAKQPTFIHIYKMIKLLNVLVLTFLILACAWTGYLRFKSNHNTLPLQTFCYDQSKTSKKQIVHYEKIGEGAFKVSSELKSFPLPDLKREMRFLGKNTRPDATIYDLLIHIGLKESGQSLKVVSGQKIYLSYVEEFKPYLKFSSEPTPLWIMPHLSETGETLVELGVRLMTEENEKLVEEKKTFEIEDLLQKEVPEKQDPLFQKAVDDLKKGQWWEPDRLFETYGGKEYQTLKTHQRMEFFYEDTPYVIPIQQEDVLIWKKGKWIKSQTGKLSRGVPMARIYQLTTHQINWELWSSDGLEKTTVTHIKNHMQPLNLRIEEVFSRIRQRTASRISCRIANKATILKIGDWVLHTPSGWRVLKSLTEIEDVLAFHSKGELFVFDGIEKSEGKSIFSGTLFDPMRTQKQKIKIPIALHSQEEHSSHKKKTISNKINSPSSEDKSLLESNEGKETKSRKSKQLIKSPEGLKQGVD